MRKNANQQLWGKFVFLIVVSLSIICLDNYTKSLTKIKFWLSNIVLPIQWLSSTPIHANDIIGYKLTSISRLLEENEELKIENIFLKQRLQTVASLSTQNNTLRKLLNSSQKIKGLVVIAEIIGVNPNPQIKQITINKGKRHGAFIGQTILDANGILGQIISVNSYESVVLLITDGSSRIPVEVNRTGYRAIAAGNHLDDDLSLLFVSDLDDIKTGDLLLSSGLAQRFPAGYPVATVGSIERIPGKHFVNIKASPLAQLNKNRLVLMIFPNKNSTKNTNRDDSSKKIEQSK